VIHGHPERSDGHFYSLPVKSCMHNPIELAWAGLKSYVRDKNVNYSLSDVRRVTYPWMTSLNRVTAVGYINETCKIQDIFKTFD
jgi:tetrahydromethanopterin S-methyltransferase subunit H